MHFKPKSGLWFAASTDNATGTPPTQPTADNQPPAAGAPSNGGETGPQTPPANKPLTFESEKDLEKYIEDALKDRLDRAQKKADKAAQEAREQAEADAAAKNGEWQKLAESREGKIKELSAQVETITSLQEKADKYERALKSHLETQRTGLPGHVIELLDRLDPVEQLEYVARNREALVTPGAANTQRSSTTGAIPPTPPACAPAQLTAEMQEQARRAHRVQVQSQF